MTDRRNKAVAVFQEGFSCSQAVLSAFSPDFGLDGTTALKIAQPFGGGMAHMGDICGAVTGGFMVIGLKYGRTQAEDTAARDRTYEIMHTFMERFRREHKSLVCRDLLGFDISHPRQYQEACEREIFDEVCPAFVRTAAAILEDIMEEPD